MTREDARLRRLPVRLTIYGAALAQAGFLAWHGHTIYAAIFAIVGIAGLVFHIAWAEAAAIRKRAGVSHDPKP